MEFQVTFFVWKQWTEHMLPSKTDVGLNAAFSMYVTFGKLHNFAEPQFPHVQSEDNTYFIRMS